MKISVILKLLTATLFMTLSLKTYAVVTYANCPTLSPLPITSFMPGAMLPIKNTQNAYNIGMNVVVKTAVNAASLLQSEAINSAFVSIMKSMMEVSQSQSQQNMEIDREYSELMLAYRSELENQKSQLEDMLFPGDPSMMAPEPGEERVIDPRSPSYKFVKEMCSAGKMQQMMVSKKVRDKSISDINRRGNKILNNIQAVGSINSASKKSVDLHYELFCSDKDLENDLCDVASSAPNADLEAYAFMYPRGNPNQDPTFQTAYTYSPVESLAAYSYIRNLMGTFYVTPPIPSDDKDSRKVKFVGAYKQMVSALSLSTNVMLEIAQAREPINNQGVIMSQLDTVSYIVTKSKLPEHVRVVKSSSTNGKLIELQKQMALAQKIKLMTLAQRNNERLLMAADVAIENTLIGSEN
jgi:hypothetical protein